MALRGQGLQQGQAGHQGQGWTGGLATSQSTGQHTVASHETFGRVVLEIGTEENLLKNISTGVVPILCSTTYCEVMCFDIMKHRMTASFSCHMPQTKINAPMFC